MSFLKKIFKRISRKHKIEDIASKVEAIIITIHKCIVMQTISVKGLDDKSDTPRLTQMLNNGQIDDFIRGYIFGISDSAVRSLLLNKNL